MMKLLHRKIGNNISVNLYGGGAMQKHLTLVLGSVLMACLATIALSFTKVEASVCQANAQPVRVPVSVPATDSNGNPTNIANFVNTRSPDATRQAFQLPPGRYPVNALIILRAGDALSGAVPSGTPRMVGPATDPDPITKLVNGAGLESLIGLRGDNAITWLDMSGADYKGRPGGGSAISAGSGNDNTLIQFNWIHENGAAGITNARGHILDNEIDHNTTESAALGSIGSGVKGMNEYEAGCNYVHDNLGNGLWGDVLMKDTAVGSFNVHDNVLSNNGRAGVRFEQTECSGAEFSAVGNVIQNNGWESVRGGVSIHDACDDPRSYVANNTFSGNYGNLAVRITDSGRSDRPDTKNVTVENNAMGGDIIKLGTGVSTSADNIVLR
jgi:hypothetical protein